MGWKITALEVMGKVRIDLILAGVENRAVIAKAIDDAYPFGVRANYPYKAWLSARKEFFARHGLPMKTSKKREPDLIDGLATSIGSSNNSSAGMI